jgi:membrane protein DedA with SNARE-associated domain
MNLESYMQPVIDFVRANQSWAPLIVGLLAFGESLALISFFIPATALLLGIGALVGASGVPFWTVWLGVVIGGVLGDWVSYAVGYHFKDRALTAWPLVKYPTAVAQASAFTQKWGAWGVFFGRFSGPLRAFVPLAAGIFGMPSVLFQAANVASAVVWAFILLAPGFAAVKFW